MLDVLENYLVAIVPCLTAVVSIITATIAQVQKFKKSLRDQELTRADEVKEVKNARKEMREIVKLNKQLMIENIELKNQISEILKSISKVREGETDELHKKL